FFFSSRRRHTRCLSDWSSDVCSSDLALIDHQWGNQWGISGAGLRARPPHNRAANLRANRYASPGHLADTYLPSSTTNAGPSSVEIGRASCRERVWGAGVDRARKEEGG